MSDNKQRLLYFYHWKFFSENQKCDFCHTFTSCDLKMIVDMFFSTFL